MSRYLGLDASTQSITGLIIDTDTGTIAAEESVNFDEHFAGKYGVENGVVDKGGRSRSQLSTYVGRGTGTSAEDVAG